MKIIRNLLIVFAVIFILAGSGAYFYLQTLDVNQFKPQITDELKKALGREVVLGNIKLKISLTQGIALELKDLKIADDAQFSANNFIRINAVYLNVDVLAYLKTKTVSVTKLSVDSPHISLIRNEAGVFNYQSIIDHTLAEQKSTQTSSSSTKALAQNNSASLSGLPLLIVKTIELKNGNVLYQDKMPATSMTVPLNKIDVTVKDFSLDKPFMLDAYLSVFSDIQNIQGTGQVKVDLASQSAFINQLNIKSDLAQMKPVLLKQAIASLAPVNFDGGFKGQITAFIDDLNAGSAGIKTLKANVQLAEGELKLKEIFSPFTNMSGDVDINEVDVMVKSFSTGFASGQISGEGRLDDYLKTQKPSFKIDIEQIQAAQVVDPALLPAQVEGKITLQLSGEAQGLKPEQLKSSLTGKGKFNLIEGRIKDINLLKSILEKMSALPAIGGVNLADEVSQRLPESYKEKLALKDTIIDDCHTDLQFVNGAVQYNDLTLQSNGMRVSLSGQIDLDQNVVLGGEVALDQTLSASLVASQQAFSYLLNNKNEIAIPLTRYQGKLAQLKVLPDFKDFASNVIVNKGKEELKNVIFKALDIETKPNPSSNNSQNPAETSQPANNQPESTPEQKAIESLINQIPIFGGKKSN